MKIPLIPAPVKTSTQGEVSDGSDIAGVVIRSPELMDVVTRFVEDVRLDAGIALSVSQGIGLIDGRQITVLIDDDGIDGITPASGLRADGKLTTGAGDERYGLEISDAGVRIWGPTAEAVHRGLTSIRQFIAASPRGRAATSQHIRIVDGPRFGWRGLSLDVARTFYSSDVIRRVIDMCSLYKLNVLHLHLTDDQGWRIEVPSRPALTEIGAIGAYGDRPGGYYTCAEMAALVAYAGQRFVTIVPEIDMPGHCAAVFRSYPDLTTQDVHSASVDGDFGLELPALDPDRIQTWDFVEDVWADVIPQFPQSAYVHIGGDEAFGMSDEAHAAFVVKVVMVVRNHGKRVIGWQEVARAALSPEEVVQYWMDARDTETIGDTLAAMVPKDVLPIFVEHIDKGKADVARALARGCKLLVSPTSRLYFDRPHADSSIDAAQNEARQRVGQPMYPSATSIRDGIEWDPVGDTPGVYSDEPIVGLEGAIWCETISCPDDLQLMLMPRLCGLAEKAWARQTTTAWNDYAARLGWQSAIWQHRGWVWFQSAEVEWTIQT